MWLLVAGVALISLASWPPLIVAGAQVSDLVCAFGAVLAIASLRRLPMPALGGLVMAGAYGLAACVSTVLAGGNAVRLLGYLWLVALGYAIAATASTDPIIAARLRRALVVAAIIGAITGLVGAVLYALGYWTPLLNHAGDLVPGDYPRIRGTMLRANALAGLVATGLLLLGDIPRRWRPFVAGLLLIALLFTFSRSWISLAAAFAVATLALTPHHSRGRDLAAWAVVLATIAVMLAVSWLDIRLDPSRPWAVELGPGEGTRLIHLRDALDTIAAHPLIGVGPGGTATLDGWDAHFMPVNVAALLGIPAALALAFLIAFALGRAARAARAGDAGARGVAAGLVLFCLDALARDVEDQRALWILIGLALACRAGNNRRNS